MPIDNSLRARMVRNAQSYNRNLTAEYLQKLPTHQLLSFCGPDERSLFASEIVRK